MGHTKNEVDLNTGVTHFFTVNALQAQNLLSISMYYEMGAWLLSYSFPKHPSISFAGSGAAFHHIDGSVEADRALFHALK